MDADIEIIDSAAMTAPIVVAVSSKCAAGATSPASEISSTVAVVPVVASAVAALWLQWGAEKSGPARVLRLD